MKKYKYEIIVFIVDAVCMILELVTSRVLAPYFGTSNFVWTSVIGIILLSTSLGNYLGGKIADKPEKKEVNNSLKIIFLMASLFIITIPTIQDVILNIIKKISEDIRIGAILSTITLFFIPSLLLGMVTPIIMKLKLENLENSGKSIGKISAIGTIGGIIGTFAGGFWLIPIFGSIQMLYVIAIIVGILIFFVDFKIEKIYFIYFVILTIISIISIWYVNIEYENGSNKVINGEINKYTSFDTEYGRVIVYNEKRGKDNLRILNIDSGFESITYTDENKKYELFSKYTDVYNIIFDINKNIENTLMIGGAGYSYPKYYISHFPNKNIDVVEIDGEITNIAKKYFFLDDLIEEYNLEENNRLGLITEDGRIYLNNNTKKYDAILNDAFSGNSPAKILTTLECVQNIKKSLNEEGLYLSNIISSLDGENSKFIKAEVNTLKQVFKNVYVIPCGSTKDPYSLKNNIVVATDKDCEIENTYNLKIDENEIILTDNYCPLETIIPKI